MKSPMKLLLCEPCAASPIKTYSEKVEGGVGYFWMDMRIIGGLIELI